LLGIYTLNDVAAGTNWWTEASNQTGAGILNPMAYRTTEAGGSSQTMNPAPVTSIDSAFTSTATITGTWTLRFNDSGEGDPGIVNAANLTFNTAAVTPHAPQVDFDGDGESDGDEKNDFCIFQDGFFILNRYRNLEKERRERIGQLFLHPQIERRYA